MHESLLSHYLSITHAQCDFKSAHDRHGIEAKGGIFLVYILIFYWIPILIVKDIIRDILSIRKGTATQLFSLYSNYVS